MSPRKIGALVSIEQTQTLQEQIATGIPLDAVVTGELLINISSQIHRFMMEQLSSEITRLRRLVLICH